MSEQLPPTHYLDPVLLQKLGDLELIAREVVEGLRVGSHRSPLKGFSTEFAHHRQYVPGDAIRNIDWRVYGRTERYYTKLYEAETNFDCHLLIDASASMATSRPSSNATTPLLRCRMPGVSRISTVVAETPCVASHAVSWRAPS